MKLLFVCMGNICRSPVVEAVARAEFARAGFSIDVASAGTEDYHVGEPADPRAIASAKAHGYDVSRHRARQIVAADFARFDAVLAMDRVNLSALARCCPPEHERRAALFLPFAGLETPDEVPDPYYGKARDFERVIELARAGVERLIRSGALAHNGGTRIG
ncbi:MAG TPA: low molecular weight protein-tyrosine-phosphatase [Rudaea sp.]|nr:low molecular weight protein-tyrosine-phosphatase [Rudaea sp.]